MRLCTGRDGLREKAEAPAYYFARDVFRIVFLLLILSLALFYIALSVATTV
jgi:hypothetical protein